MYYTYRAAVLKVVDGDTLDVDLDLGMRIHFHVRLRVAHIDTPETSTPEGKQVRDYVRELLPVGTVVTVSTEKPDKYGRALADVLLPDGRELAHLLVNQGMAKPYEGGSKT